MQLEEIKKLAKLARIDMSEEEMSSIAHDFDAILAYVGQVKEAANLIKNDLETLDVKNSGRPTSEFKLENVMREDIATENPGEYSDDIIKEMPDKDGRYLKVKQIL